MLEMTNSCWFCSRRINKHQIWKIYALSVANFSIIILRTKTMQPQRRFLLSRCTNLRIFFSSIKFKYTRWRNGYTSQTLSDKELSNIRGETNKTNEISLSEAHSLSSLHVYPGNMFHHCSYVKPYLSLYI